jgi:hypothetical protein
VKDRVLRIRRREGGRRGHVEDVDAVERPAVRPGDALELLPRLRKGDVQSALAARAPRAGTGARASSCRSRAAPRRRTGAPPGSRRRGRRRAPRCRCRGPAPSGRWRRLGVRTSPWNRAPASRRCSRARSYRHAYCRSRAPGFDVPATVCPDARRRSSARSTLTTGAGPDHAGLRWRLDPSRTVAALFGASRAPRQEFPPSQGPRKGSVADRRRGAAAASTPAYMDHRWLIGASAT